MPFISNEPGIRQVVYFNMIRFSLKNKIINRILKKKNKLVHAAYLCSIIMGKQ